MLCYSYWGRIQDVLTSCVAIFETLYDFTFHLFWVYVIVLLDNLVSYPWNIIVGDDLLITFNVYSFLVQILFQ